MAKVKVKIILPLELAYLLVNLLQTGINPDIDGRDKLILAVSIAISKAGG